MMTTTVKTVMITMTIINIGYRKTLINKAVTKKVTALLIRIQFGLNIQLYYYIFIYHKVEFSY